MGIDLSKYRRRPGDVPAPRPTGGGAQELFEEDGSASKGPPTGAEAAGARTSDDGTSDTREYRAPTDSGTGDAAADEVMQSMLLRVHLQQPRQARLDQRWYDAVLDRISAEPKRSDKGPWVRLDFTAKVTHGGEDHYPRFICSNTLKSGSRLYGFLEGLLGEVPEDLDLASIQGMPVRVQIVHETDASGNVWDGIGAMVKR